jgi:ketosteroid isomerase-like protein
MTNDSAVVRTLWQRFEQRDWSEARLLLAGDAVMTWVCTAERFTGGDAVIAVNAAYPEGWSIHVLDVATLGDGRILSLVRVEHPPQRFFATSLFRVAGGLIREIEEYWATAEPPPAWRSAGTLRGYEMLAVGRP